mmetsp:Transcript_24691/g.78064  ORF Transcript_24691/g.78064 Transcript_24691/m.78064 type:complete len:218 (-) Transcript_24691:4875-5528(-)
MCIFISFSFFSSRIFFAAMLVSPLSPPPPFCTATLVRLHIDFEDPLDPRRDLPEAWLEPLEIRILPEAWLEPLELRRSFSVALSLEASLIDINLRLMVFPRSLMVSSSHTVLTIARPPASVLDTISATFSPTCSIVRTMPPTASPTETTVLAMVLEITSRCSRTSRAGVFFFLKLLPPKLFLKLPTSLSCRSIILVEMERILRRDFADERGVGSSSS